MKKRNGRGGVVRLSWLLGALAMPMAIACGNATDDSMGPPSVDDFVADFAESYCSSIASCCTRQGFATTGCNATLQAPLRAQLERSLSNPKIRYNADAAGACIDAYSSALSACVSPEAEADIEDACHLVLQGTVALGGECGTDIECERSATTAVICSGGVCVLARRPYDLSVAPHRKLGEPCSGTCDGSRSEASCKALTVDANPSVGACWATEGVFCSAGVCAPAPTVGESCSYYCNDGAHCAAEVCVAELSSGPCVQDSDCLASTRCDALVHMCVPLKANGEPCAVSQECLGGECYEDHCRTWTVASANTCLGVLDD